MAQQVLNEEQMREYVEQEVRKALMNENIDENTFESLFGNGGNGINWINILNKLPGFSWETLIFAALGKVAIGPIIRKLLGTIGIPAESKFAEFIIDNATAVGGAYLGDWIDKNHNLFGN